ncbi:hypothetical protein J4457_05480 [Candidatus Woesearchaeota archaeon]|nr:hypothetical protein [Candidatus Woesearchaeota archaeon]
MNSSGTNGLKIAKILAFIVMLGGVIVVIGWILGVPLIKSIMPQWVAMKFSTAISFFLSGLILY